MKLQLTPEQVELLIAAEKEVLIVKKNRQLAEIEKQFNLSVAKLAKKYSTFDFPIVTDDLNDESTVIDEYTKASRKLNSTLYKAKKEGKTDEVALLEAERTALNIKFGKINRKKQIDLISKKMPFKTERHFF